MAAAVLLTGLFFAAVTIWKFGALEERLAYVPPEPAKVVWAHSPPESFDQQMQIARAQAAYNLEREVIARKYNQNSLAFASRSWTRFMGFVTGMMLALVGAAFVLGKLDSGQNEIAASTSGLSVTMRSASPGLMLAVLGTLLMATSIAFGLSLSTSDSAVYFDRVFTSASDTPGKSRSPSYRTAAPDAEQEPQLKVPAKENAQ